MPNRHVVIHHHPMLVSYWSGLRLLSLNENYCIKRSFHSLHIQYIHLVKLAGCYLLVHRIFLVKRAGCVCV